MLHMKNEESIQTFLSRVKCLANQMQTLGEEIKDSTLVAKVLRSLTTKFSHVVAAIEESKDLETYTFEELSGSLYTDEIKLNLEESTTDKVLYSQGGTSRERGRGGFRGRGRGRDRGRGRSSATNYSNQQQ
jgi:gag-polypeptide of LTR copia-type